MSLIFRLALRDLKGGLKGLGLLWICLAVAIAGLASVTSLASSVDSAIAASGRERLGGDLMLSVAQRDATIDEGMVLSVQSWVAEEGVGGCLQRGTVRVEGSGPSVLSRYGRL